MRLFVRGKMKRVVTLFIIWIVLFHCNCNTVDDDGMSCHQPVEAFKVFSCQDSTMETVLKAEVAWESTQETVALCAFSCNTKLRAQCKYAVYLPSKKSCKHKNNPTSLSNEIPDYVKEASECVVIKKVIPPSDQLECQNNGELRTSTCFCYYTHRGRFCELENAPQCVGSYWVQPSSATTFSILSKSVTPMKMQYKSLIVPVKSMDAFPDRSSFVIQAYSHFAMEEDNVLTFPLVREFLFFNIQNHTVSRAVIDSNLTVSVTDDEDPTVNLAFQEGSMEPGIIYDGNNSDSMQPLLTGLSNGYRLLDRGSSRVLFDIAQEEAVSEHFRGTLEVDQDPFTFSATWEMPLRYKSFTDSIKGTRHILQHNVETPIQTESYKEEVQQKWEMDVCWTKIEETFDYYEFTSVLKEYVLNGHDIRLVIDGKESTDISTFTITRNDVVAELPEKLSPFTLMGSLDGDSKSHYSVISRSKRLVECETSLNGVKKQITEHFLSKVEWYVSTRQWTKYVSISGTGEVVEGSESDLYYTALDNNNVRVCVVNGENAVCHGATAIQLSSDHNVLLQSPAFFRLRYDAGGLLESIFDQNCERYLRLVNSYGYAKQFQFDIDHKSNNEEQYVAFDRIDWYVDY